MHGTNRTLRPELGQGGVQTHTQHLDGSTRPINPAHPSVGASDDRTEVGVGTNLHSQELNLDVVLSTHLSGALVAGWLLGHIDALLARSDLDATLLRIETVVGPDRVIIPLHGAIEVVDAA